MTQRLVVFETGTGGSLEIVALNTGDAQYPERISIEVTTLSAKNATTVAISASCEVAGQTLKIPAGVSLPFLDPVTGNTKMATLSAAFSAALSTGSGPYTATGSLALVANHEAIAVDSTSSNFIPLDTASTFEAGIKFTDESVFLLNSGFWKQGQVLTGEGDFKCGGVYSSISAASRTLQDRTIGLKSLDGASVICPPANNFWIVATTVAPTPDFESGTVVRAICYLTSYPIKVEAAKITKQDLDIKVNGEVFVDPPIVA